MLYFEFLFLLVVLYRFSIWWYWPRCCFWYWFGYRGVCLQDTNVSTCHRNADYPRRCYLCLDPRSCKWLEIHAASSGKGAQKEPETCHLDSPVRDLFDDFPIGYWPRGLLNHADHR